MSDRELFNSFMRCVDHKITGGEAHLWDCYPGGWHYDADNEFAGMAIIADYRQGIVYEANIIPNNTGDGHRWINPKYTQAFRNEATERGIDWEECLEGEKWVDYDDFEVFLVRASQVRGGPSYSPLVDMPLELDHETIAGLALAAHEKGVTLNEYIVDGLKAYLDTLPEPEAPAE